MKGHFTEGYIVTWNVPRAIPYTYDCPVGNVSYEFRLADIEYAMSRKSTELHGSNRVFYG